MACFAGTLEKGRSFQVFFPALFFEFVLSYRAERKAEQRVEQTRFRDKQNLPPTAGDGNYSGSGHRAASLWLCKVHSKSQSLSSLHCQAVCLFSSSPKIRIQKESKKHHYHSVSLMFHLLGDLFPSLCDTFLSDQTVQICHCPTFVATTSYRDHQSTS